MKALNDKILEVRRKAKPPRRPPQPKTWTEEDVISGKVVDVFVIILPTRGCSWALSGGCSMCGYSLESGGLETTGEDVWKHFESAFEKYEGQPFVKIYTSGSFLDSKEVPPDVRENVINSLIGKAKRLLFESRPQYVTEDALASLPDGISYELAIGLETASEFVAEYSINKGFNFSDFRKASELARSNGVKIRTYLMLKPPFLSEREAINDVLASIEKAAPHSDCISINPINIQKFTLVERLWKRREYRPPWQWSLVEVLEKGAPLAKEAGTRLVSTPSGGGSRRGVRNCGKCDSRILDAVSRFSLSGNPEDLPKFSCGCQREWEDLLELEALAQTSTSRLS